MNPGVERDGWRARLELEMTSSQGRTVLSHNRHLGPLVVQRPFYPEGPQTCHLYILHPPGGVVAGDSLGLSASLKSGAQALITTPAAGKIYRSQGPQSLLSNHLSLEPGAVLEWMPQETIVYDQARAHQRTRVELQGDAKFLGWEIVCLGLAASGRPYQAGQVRQDLEIWRDGAPLLLERARYQGGSPALEARWGLAGCPVSGTMVASGGTPELAQAVRQAVRQTGQQGIFAVTVVSGLLICRYLGWEAEGARKRFFRAWRVIRPALLGREICPPRIWSM